MRNWSLGSTLTVAAIVTLLAGFTTSIAYERLAQSRCTLSDFEGEIPPTQIRDAERWGTSPPWCYLAPAPSPLGEIHSWGKIAWGLCHRVPAMRCSCSERRKRHQQAAEPQEPGHVEGPYEIDRVGLGVNEVDCRPLQDLMNSRHQDGYELVSHTHPVTGVSLLVWRKTND